MGRDSPGWLLLAFPKDLAFATIGPLTCKRTKIQAAGSRREKGEESPRRLRDLDCCESCLLADYVRSSEVLVAVNSVLDSIFKTIGSLDLEFLGN